MTKLQIVMDAIHSGMRFSWNLDGIQAFKKTDRTESVSHVYESKVGYILQEAAARGINNSDYYVSFEPTPEGLKIYY